MYTSNQLIYYSFILKDSPFILLKNLSFFVMTKNGMSDDRKTDAIIPADRYHMIRVFWNRSIVYSER